MVTLKEAVPTAVPGEDSAGMAGVALLPMAQGNQHSDLLFDFGPKGVAEDGSPLDWVPADSRPFDSKVVSPVPTMDLASDTPLPASVPASNGHGTPAASAPPS